MAHPIIAQTDGICFIGKVPPVLETPMGIPLKQLAVQIARADGLNPYLFLLIVSRESHWSPKAISPTADYGLCQIHLAAHPGITVAQAFNPSWCLTWMGNAWHNGHANWWSTYNAYMASIQ